jgi:hypothetical protein
VVDDGNLKDPKITSRADQTVPNAQRPVAGGRVVSRRDRGGKKPLVYLHTYTTRDCGVPVRTFFVKQGAKRDR